jgi:hypothetical protein
MRLPVTGGVHAAPCFQLHEAHLYGLRACRWMVTSCNCMQAHSHNLCMFNCFHCRLRNHFFLLPKPCWMQALPRSAPGKECGPLERATRNSGSPPLDSLWCHLLCVCVRRVAVCCASAVRLSSHRLARHFFPFPFSTSHPPSHLTPSHGHPSQLPSRPPRFLAPSLCQGLGGVDGSPCTQVISRNGSCLEHRAPSSPWASGCSPAVATTYKVEAPRGPWRAPKATATTLPLSSREGSQRTKRRFAHRCLQPSRAREVQALAW